MQQTSVLAHKSLEFAVRIVQLHRHLNAEHREYTLSKQILRSGTAIGALVREAAHGESRADFIHKLSVAQKECNETLYWLELLARTAYLTESQYQSLLSDATEILKILTASIKTVKAKNINH